MDKLKHNLIGLLKGVGIATACVAAFAGMILVVSILTDLGDKNPKLANGILVFIFISILGYCIAHDKNWFK